MRAVRSAPIWSVRSSPPGTRWWPPTSSPALPRRGRASAPSTSPTPPRSTPWSARSAPTWCSTSPRSCRRRGEKNPALAYAVNQTGTWNVLEACRAPRRRPLPLHVEHRGLRPRPARPRARRRRRCTRPRCTASPRSPASCSASTTGRNYGLDCRGVRFPGLISAALPGGGSTDYALFMYVDGVRRGAYEAFARADTRIPLMYMPDGVRALLELSTAPRERLGRCVYNIAAFSPPRRRDRGLGAAAPSPASRSPTPPIPLRQSILDSWPTRPRRRPRPRATGAGEPSLRPRRDDHRSGAQGPRPGRRHLSLEESRHVREMPRSTSPAPSPRSATPGCGNTSA